MMLMVLKTTRSMRPAMWILQVKPHPKILNEGTVGVAQVSLVKYINTIFSWWRTSINLIPWHKHRLFIFKYRTIKLAYRWYRSIDIGPWRRFLKVNRGSGNIAVDSGRKIVFLVVFPTRSWMFSPFQRWRHNIVLNIVTVIKVVDISIETMFCPVVITNVIIPMMIVDPASLPVAMVVVSIKGGTTTTMLISLCLQIPSKRHNSCKTTIITCLLMKTGFILQISSYFLYSTISDLWNQIPIPSFVCHNVTNEISII